MKKINKLLQKYILYIALIISLISTLGSLYFSEILQFPPCALCWYQRIAMYPLVVILAVGIQFKDKLLPYYVLPLSIAGAVIALFHNMLYYKILPESAQPCLLGVSCTTKYIEWFGLITIPLLSLFSFIIIIVSVVIYEKLKVKS